MFVLRSLGKLLGGGERSADGNSNMNEKVIKLPVGIANGKEWNNLNSSLTIKRLSIFDYELLLQENEDGDKCQAFPIKKETLNFTRKYGDDGQVIFTWNDNFTFTIPMDETTPTMIELFHLMVAQCLYEGEHRMPHTEASEEDIEKYIVILQQEAKREVNTLQLEDCVFESEACLFYVFDSKSNTFLPYKSNSPVKAIISKDFKLSIICIDDSMTILHEQDIDPDATIHTDKVNLSFIWCHLSTDDALIWTFSLRFANLISLMALSNGMGQVIYEILNQVKMREEDRSYLMKSYDVDMTDVSDYSDSEGSDRSESETEAEDTDYKDQIDNNETNQMLAVGYKHDRSFVKRGEGISVFKHTKDDSLEHYTNIKKVTTSKGTTLTPTAMMLHDEDRSMLLTTASDPSMIYKMDLEYGKVVEDWTVHPDTSLKALIPDTKYSQMTSNQTLIGLASNSIFRIDPRLSGTKRCDDEMKQYVVKNEFTCGATTGSGNLAVASAKGEIRLFGSNNSSALGKKAKTLLPGFGDPIIGIDVTENGRYILATCKTYLLFICTDLEGGNGFTTPMGKQKPVPKRLQLKPEHVAYMQGIVSFTPAKFSTGTIDERSIITSTGQYVVTWNLRRVKTGNIYDYQLRKYDQNVVADGFRYGQDRQIVVTLPQHVTMISKKSLASPSSLFTL